MSLRLLALCLIAFPLAAENIRVIRFAESDPFRMGDVTSRRIVHPGLGAKKTTLNLSVSKPGAEFAQHVHDYSDDTILVLDGEVNLRQGDSLRLFKTGQCAFVPTGQIHGTVTAGKKEATMISFQNPPDLILYSGARDSKKTGIAPKGLITPNAVKYVNFGRKNGMFSGPVEGSLRATGTHRTLKAGEKFHLSFADGGEGILFIWRGAIRANELKAGERDTIFVQGKAELEIVADGATELIQILAP